MLVGRVGWRGRPGRRWRARPAGHTWRVGNRAAGRICCFRERIRIAATRHPQMRVRRALSVTGAELGEAARFSLCSLGLRRLGGHRLVAHARGERSRPVGPRGRDPRAGARRGAEVPPQRTSRRRELAERQQLQQRPGGERPERDERHSCQQADDAALARGVIERAGAEREHGDNRELRQDQRHQQLHRPDRPDPAGGPHESGENKRQHQHDHVDGNLAEQQLEPQGERPRSDEEADQEGHERRARDHGEASEQDARLGQERRTLAAGRPLDDA